MRTGRPRKNPEIRDFERGINLFYRTYGYDKEKHTFTQTPTKSGLAICLGYCNSQEINDQMRKRPEIAPVLNRALLCLTEWWEARLSSERGGANGPKAWLENCAGWTFTQVVKVDDDQAKAISDAQRQAARELAEQMLLGRMSGGVIVQPTAQTSIVGHPEKSDIGPCVQDTTFATDKGITEFGSLDPAQGGKWAMDDDNSSTQPVGGSQDSIIPGDSGDDDNPMLVKAL
jgi:hypothetical protein